MQIKILTAQGEYADGDPSLVGEIITLRLISGSSESVEVTSDSVGSWGTFASIRNALNMIRAHYSFRIL